MNLAIVGATGNVGRKIIEVLENKKFPLSKIFFAASSKSAGSKINFRGRKILVEDVRKFDFSKSDITFFSAGRQISKKFASKAAKSSIVIDNSSFYRMDPNVPLVVPQVNSKVLKRIKKNIIANPNCSTAQLVIVLKPLHEILKIKRVIVSTYQSTSGAGKASMDELLEQTKKFLNKEKIRSKNFTKQIAFNVIPHIDKFISDGYTKEEVKMINETKKILDKNIRLTATCVRVPVLVSHAESVNIEFKKNFSLKKVKDILKKADGCKVVDTKKNGGYITQIEAEGKNDTFVSRIRRDNTNKKSINLWIVSDNLLRGAALNAVEIAKAYIKIKK